MSQIVCSNCHTINRLGARFCGKCGSLLPSQAQPPVWGSQPRGLGTGMLPQNSMVNNRYIIIQKVGQGGMGAVYKVADTQNNHQVLALKEMSDLAVDPAEKPQMVAQFMQEAVLLQRLRHPNLPYVTDKFSVGDRHYLVMEFIDGRTLQQMLDTTQRPFSEPLVIQWTVQLCDVLGYLHSQTPKIIFRDLKPDNIMVTTDNQVKLIDFGIVRFFKPGKVKDTIALGTEGYAAPEQHGSGQTDERSDVYSLGATLFHLLTAVEPRTHLFNLPPVRRLNPAVSPQTEQLIARATATKSHERFNSMQEMRTSLPAQGQPSRPQSGSGGAARGALAGSWPSQGSSVAPTARPTTRLVQATVKFTSQLSNAQLAGIGAALLAVILFSVWFITPRIQGTWFWYRVPTIALLGPAIFAATRRRGVAGVGHGVVAAVAGSLTWYRASLAGDYFGLFLGAILSGAAIESFVYFLPKITAGLKREDPETWKREAGWLGLAAVVGHILLLGLAFSFGAALHMFSLTAAFVLGCLGWFIGDLIYSAWMEKQNQKQP
jgi:predicted Ser/Thr protein kinase